MVFKKKKALFVVILICASLAQAKDVLDNYRFLQPYKNFDKDFLPLFETEVKRVGRISSQADISYLGVDLKFDGKNVKICEFLEAKNAGNPYCDLVVNRKYKKLHAPYWLLFWHYLTKFNRPVWFYGRDIRPHERVALDEFLEMGGHWVKNAQELEEHPLFSFLSQKKLSSKKSKKSSKQIRDYRGIIVYKYSDIAYVSKFAELEALKKKYPQFLFLDIASRSYAANKKLLLQLLGKMKLQKYRPKSKIYKKVYSRALASKIIRDLGCEKFVIKPLNSCKANGIIVTSKDRLDVVLQQILSKKKGPKFAYRPQESEGIKYWRKDKNKTFIVEEYCPSKKIKVRGKWYDPTMRIFFILRYENEKIYTTVLTGFWKIPPKSLDEKGSLREKHVTYPMAQDGFVGIRINETDLKKVRKTFFKILPKIYTGMLKNPSGNAFINTKEI